MVHNDYARKCVGRISCQTVPLYFSIQDNNDTLRKAFSDLLDKVVAQDSRVTRCEEQLDQLCNLVLLKLDSDKKAKMASSSEGAFRVCATASATGPYIRKKLEEFHDVYPDIFVTESEKEIRFSDTTIYKRACELAGLTALPALVRNLDDDTATILMVDSNIQQENILPSERAQAHKMKLESIKRRGARRRSRRLIKSC